MAGENGHPLQKRIDNANEGKTMEAIKQIIRIPENHELRIRVPSHVTDDDIVEVILIIRKKPQDYTQRVHAVKEAMKDPLFLQDLKETSEDFEDIDREGWEENSGV
jgi:hypothetical protein